MKINKKVLIPAFATALGLSVIGGVSGAVAWYQYNSKVTANFIGVSVEDKGVLQISEDDSDYVRSIDKTGDPDKMEIKPVTFGDTASGVGTDAWMYPEAGAGEGYYLPSGNNPGWEQAAEGTDYIQFDLYFKAYENDSSVTGGKKYVAKPVYISQSFFRCLDTNGDEDASHLADQAMRVQIDVEGGANHIIAESAANINLYGGLDLDGSGDDDIYYENPFITLPNSSCHPGDVVNYGVDGETQDAKAVATYAVGATPLFTTNASGEAVHCTVTIWMEGWAMINSKAVWDPNKTAGCDVQVALQFSTAD